MPRGHGGIVNSDHGVFQTFAKDQHTSVHCREPSDPRVRKQSGIPEQHTKTTQSSQTQNLTFKVARLKDLSDPSSSTAFRGLTQVRFSPIPHALFGSPDQSLSLVAEFDYATSEVSVSASRLVKMSKRALDASSKTAIAGVSVTPESCQYVRLAVQTDTLNSNSRTMLFDSGFERDLVLAYFNEPCVLRGSVDLNGETHRYDVVVPFPGLHFLSRNSSDPSAREFTIERFPMIGQPVIAFDIPLSAPGSNHDEAGFTCFPEDVAYLLAVDTAAAAYFAQATSGSIERRPLLLWWSAPKTLDSDRELLQRDLRIEVLDPDAMFTSARELLRDKHVSMYAIAWLDKLGLNDDWQDVVKVSVSTFDWTYAFSAAISTQDVGTKYFLGCDAALLR